MLLMWKVYSRISIRRELEYPSMEIRGHSSADGEVKEQTALGSAVFRYEHTCMC
jgi:hypothetical protein